MGCERRSSGAEAQASDEQAPSESQALFPQGYSNSVTSSSSAAATPNLGGTPGGQQGPDTAGTVQRIKLDIRKLTDGIQKTAEAAKAQAAGSGSKDLTLQMQNLTYLAAEKCDAWSTTMQNLLLRAEEERDLVLLLETNDWLNDALEKWQALVSLDVAGLGEADAVDGANSLQMLAQLGEGVSAAGTSRTVTEWEAHELGSLQQQVVMLKQALQEADAAKQAALAQAEAAMSREMTTVKGQAVRKVKELMWQLEELQGANAKLTRQLETAREALATAETVAIASQASRQLSDNGGAEELQDGLAAPEAEQELKASLAELEAAKKQLADRVVEAGEAEEQLKAEISRMRSRVGELEIQVADKEGATQQAEAEAKAAAALHVAEAASMRHQLETLQQNASQVGELKSRAETAEKALVSMKLELRKESILRKKAHNEIRELKGNIRVLCRIRPANVGAQAAAGEADVAMQAHDEYTLNLGLDLRGDFVNKRYEFDTVFEPDCAQEQVYAETSSLLQSAMDGYNVCVFCYGQTGSGKTFTITGTPEQPGIIPRCMADIMATNSDTVKVTVHAYMLELYQDMLLDLLSQEPSLPHEKVKLKLKTSEKGIVQVDGAVVKEATTLAELDGIFQQGLSRRKTASTKMNIESSRSHLIFTILLDYENTTTRARSSSKVSFVDLAGSERVARSGAVNDKDRLNEAKAINKSLSALGDVVAALTSHDSFVPYRNHKLTELMKDSVGGNAKTLMILNVSPLAVDAAESRNSLEYAQRVKQVTNETSRSFETKETARLNETIRRLREELAAVKAGGNASEGGNSTGRSSPVSPS